MTKISISALEASIPRRLLGVYPTPLIVSGGLKKKVGGPNLWFKRDDLISFGLGGNKVRGLEIIATDITEKQSDVVITGAGVQSNHVRATAALASFLGIEMVAVYWGHQPNCIDGNYRMAKLLGAKTFFTEDPDRSSVDWGIDKVAAELSEAGRRTYPIPRGGACPLGVLGHVLAVCETARQCNRIDLKPDFIILATGSGGTHAGWLLGTRLLGLDWTIKSFSVSRPAEEARHQVARLANEAAKLIGRSEQFSADLVDIDDNFIGEGYGIPTDEGALAIELTGRCEGMLFDPTYTGKAMAGYLSGVRNHQFSNDQSVLFIHSGGEPAFFAGKGAWLCR